MGYDLHITRKEFWADDEGPVISLDEWRAYVETDPEVAQDPDNGPGDFLYIDHPAAPHPLWWGNGGEVYTKNPDKAAVRKLIQTARSLNARVVGDDGEAYSNPESFPDPDPEPSAPRKKGFFAKPFG
jgi:hypothetical protein